MIRALGLAMLLAAPAWAQDAAPLRVATAQDRQMLDGPKFKPVAVELGRMGLRQRTGKACRTFVTTDSVRGLETPFSINDTDVNLPFESFLIWSDDRPFADAVLYHVFGAADALYKTPQTLAAGATKAKVPVTVALAPRQPYPSADEVARARAALGRGALLRSGASQVWTVQPYALPTEPDAAASTFPRKDEDTLRRTCLSDPQRVTSCLCAATD